MERYSKTSFGIRDLSKESHWSDDIENFKITKPIFICLSGNGTTNSKKANGQAARNERLMGLKPKDDKTFGTYANIDIISFYYGKNKESDSIGSLTFEESQSIVEQLFLPLFIDEKNFKRLPLIQACENFSNVIFSSFCYGSECVNDLLFDLKNYLLAYRFTEAEVEEIFSHSFHISYSPIKADEFLPFVQINSFEDSFSKTFDMDKWFETKFGYQLNGVKICSNKKYFYEYLLNSRLKPCHKEINIYTSKLVNNSTENINEHSSAFIDLDSSWQASPQAQNSKNSECVSKITGLLLAMAGARALNIHRKKSPLKQTNLEEMLEAANSLLETYSQSELERN